MGLFPKHALVTLPHRSLPAMALMVFVVISCSAQLSNWGFTEKASYNHTSNNYRDGGTGRGPGFDFEVNYTFAQVLKVYVAASWSSFRVNDPQLFPNTRYFDEYGYCAGLRYAPLPGRGKWKFTAGPGIMAGKLVYSDATGREISGAVFRPGLQVDCAAGRELLSGLDIFVFTRFRSVYKSMTYNTNDLFSYYSAGLALSWMW